MSADFSLIVIIGIAVFILVFILYPFIKGYFKGPERKSAPKRPEQKSQPRTMAGQQRVAHTRQQTDGTQQKTDPRSFAPDNIFISYRREDSADVTGRIYDRLIARFGGAVVFKDVDSIPLGLDFKAYLDETVGKSSVFLVVIGKRWLVKESPASSKLRLEDPRDFVRIEIESALRRNIPVIPLLVSGARLPTEEQLPSSLRGLVYRNGIQIRPDPDFHRDMDRLISAIEAHLTH